MFNKNTIAEVILDFQKDDLPQASPRNLKVDLELPLKRATTILGPRRSGKTYYFFYLIKNLFYVCPLKSANQSQHPLVADFFYLPDTSCLLPY